MSFPTPFRLAVPSLLAALAFTFGAARAEVPADTVLASELAAMDAVRLAFLNMEEAPLLDLAQKYREALERRRDAQRTAGNLEGVAAADREIARLDAGDDSPSLPGDSELARLRRAYLTEKARLTPLVESRRVDIEREHARALEVMVADLTRDDRIVQAARVSATREAFIADFVARRERAAQPAPGTEREFEIAEGVPVTFCWIPAGDFLMGSPREERWRNETPSENQILVRITRGFWMAKTETTQDQWFAVAGDRPSHFSGGDLPVERVGWHDICGNDQRTGGFLEKANRMAPDGWRFDLPTEAEWEYACRAGTTSSLNNGTDITTEHGLCPHLDPLAWFDSNSEGRTHPVGLKEPNAWGLHDMHGNVWEWCADFGVEWTESALVDPIGRQTERLRVYRGGSWRHHAQSQRSAHRSGDGPGLRFYTLGFRLVLREAPIP